MDLIGERTLPRDRAVEALIINRLSQLRRAKEEACNRPNQKIESLSTPKRIEMGEVVNALRSVCEFGRSFLVKLAKTKLSTIPVTIQRI